MLTTRAADPAASGRTSTASAALYTAVVAPIARTSVTIAASVNVGVRRRLRKACRISDERVYISNLRAGR
jgi:hypothetical protein